MLEHMKSSGHIKNLKKAGFVTIAYPADLRFRVMMAVQSWKTFCELPEATKKRLPYNPGSGMGVGYELKKTQGKSLDLKEDLHVTLGQSQWLRDAAVATGEAVLINLINDASNLIDLMRSSILSFAREVEKEYNLKDFAQEVGDSKDQWFLRFIHYFGGAKVGDEIGKSHADKSGFTLHLHESDPGLQKLNFKKQWDDMPVSEGETVIIPGMRLQYRSRGELKALFHRVIANEITAISGRYSMVCFVHLKRTAEYDKDAAGRLQEFLPGFNYEMPFGEFSKLFRNPR
jgi:isopenicillin N synthase-like dioxygenase